MGQGSLERGLFPPWGCRTCSGHLWPVLQMGRVRSGIAGLMQEHRREQRCWMLCREDVLLQLPVILGGTQDHTWQGAGPGLALLAGCFTECNSLCTLNVPQNICLA